MKFTKIFGIAAVASLSLVTLAVAEGGNEDSLVGQTADAHIVQGLEIVANNESLGFGVLAKDNDDDSKCWMAPDGDDPDDFDATNAAGNPGDGECNYETETYVGGSMPAHVGNDAIGLAEFNVTGEPGFSYLFEVKQGAMPALTDTIIIDNGTDDLEIVLHGAGFCGAVADGVDDDDSVMTWLAVGQWDAALNAGGADTVYIGGTLCIDNDDTSGHYDGTYNVYVSYN